MTMLEEASKLKIEPILSTTENRNRGTLHFARRGERIDDVSSDESDIAGFDPERMRARAALTEAEEKKLMRRIRLAFDATLLSDVPVQEHRRE